MLLPHTIAVHTASVEAVPGGSVIGKQWNSLTGGIEAYIEPARDTEVVLDNKNAMVIRPHWCYCETSHSALFIPGSKVTKAGSTQRYFTVKNFPAVWGAESDLDYLRVALQENQFGE